MRSIFIRLKTATPDKNIKLLALQTVQISTDLYGLDTLSVFELEKILTKPTVEDS